MPIQGEVVRAGEQLHERGKVKGETKESPTKLFPAFIALHFMPSQQQTCRVMVFQVIYFLIPKKLTKIKIIKMYVSHTLLLSVRGERENSIPAMKDALLNVHKKLNADEFSHDAATTHSDSSHACDGLSRKGNNPDGLCITKKCSTFFSVTSLGT